MQILIELFIINISNVLKFAVADFTALAASQSKRISDKKS